MHIICTQIGIYLPICRLPCRPMELELPLPGTVEHPPLDFCAGTPSLNGCWFGAGGSAETKIGNISARTFP